MILQRGSNSPTDPIEYILLVFLVLIPLVGWSQESHVDTLQASLAFRKADSLRKLARYDSSNTYFQKAADFYKKARAWKRVADVLYLFSLNTSDLGQMDKSAQYLERALKICRQQQFDDRLFKLKAHNQKGAIALTRGHYKESLQWYNGVRIQTDTAKSEISIKIRSIIGIGDNYDEQGKYSEALRQFHKAEDLYHRRHLQNKKLLSHIYSSSGISYQHNGEGNSSLKYHRQALHIDQEILPHDHPELAKDYNNIAIVYYYRGDYKRALDYMKNAVNILQKFYGENHKLVAAGYNNVGVTYSEMGNLKEATKYLKKALAIKKKILGADHPDIAIGYQNLGAIYYDMKKYNQAISYSKKAEKLDLKRFPNGHPELANVYDNLGQAYAGKQLYQKALDYYQKDLDTNLKFLASDHPYIGDTFNKIGKAYSKLKNYQMALSYFEKTLPIFVNGYSKESGLQNPSLEQIVYPEKLLKTLELKAETLSDYSRQKGDQALLDQSLHTYLNAVQLIEKLQYSLSRNGSKFVLRKKTHGLFQKGFKTAFTLYRQTGNSDYKEYAFYFAEKSKDQILLEQLQETHAEHFAGIPDSLIQKGHSLEKRLTKLQQKLSSLAGSPQQSDSLKRISLEDSLFDVHQGLDAHIQTLEQNYPKYYKLKYRHTTFPSWRVQQQLLSAHQNIIEYFIGADSLYAFVISKEQFHLRKIASDSMLSDDIDRYRKTMMQGNDPANFADASHHLYQKLFQPLASLVNMQQLIIVPDGPLDLLPFESLVVENSKKGRHTSFKTLSYLINKYTVSYVPSIKYLDIKTNPHPTKPQKMFLGFAPVFKKLTIDRQRSLYPDVKRPLNALPLSKTEVEDVKDLFNKPHGFWSFLKPDKDEAHIYEESEATEEQFKSLTLSNYNYIHLATHAFVSEDHPGQSGIVFTAKANGQDDGILYASEIYNLNLSAQLVTLSACNTGIGKIAKGEGMMSLSRAFQYAGARNLLVSLWNVDDRSTAKLMVDFYTKNEQEMKIPGALRDAKIDLINKGRYAQPKYWASFILIGQ